MFRENLGFVRLRLQGAGCACKEGERKVVVGTRPGRPEEGHWPWQGMEPPVAAAPRSEPPPAALYHLDLL